MALILRDVEDQLKATQFGPSHFLIRIESFSLLSKSSVDKYECNEFESGGFKWTLVIYPNGKDQANSDHVSVYLSIAKPASLGMDWEVNALFSIFLQNQTTESFVCKGLYAPQRFDALSHARGFARFVPKDVLMETCNGYLVDDCCVFGAQVFVFKKPTIECLSWTKTSTPQYLKSWTISKFSKLRSECYTEKFDHGGKKWSVIVYLKGSSGVEGQSLSVVVELVDPGLHRVNAKYTVRIRNQKDNKHHQLQLNDIWFSASSSLLAQRDFMPIADISDKKKGFLVKGCVILELELTVLAVTHAG